LESVEFSDEDIKIIRSNGRILGHTCYACEKRPLGDKEDVLMLDMTFAQVILCRWHEGLLLRKLLENFVRRRKKDSKVGFSDPIERKGLEAKVE